MYSEQFSSLSKMRMISRKEKKFFKNFFDTVHVRVPPQNMFIGLDILFLQFFFLSARGLFDKIEFLS